MSTVMRGEIVGVEFQPSDVGPDRIVVRVAVAAEERIGKGKVVLLDAEEAEDGPE